MALVLDASVAACWALDDEADPRADQALEMLRTQAALVPALWWFELRNILIVAERKGRIYESETATFLRSLGRLNVTVERAPDEVALLTLARRHHLTVYDTAYLELATRTGAPLATLDRQLADAARSERVAVL